MITDRSIMAKENDDNAGSDYHTFTNPPDEKKENPSKDYAISEAIEHIGFGWFQAFIAFASGFAWIADGMEIMVISILGPTLVCEWGISTVQEAALTTVVFVGFLIGSPTFGYFADRFGRRKALLVSSLWISFFGVCSAFSPSLPWLYSLRFFVGFGVGGGQQACTYFAEFLPNKYRGSGIMCVEIFFALGAAVEVVLGILILLPYGWQWWLGASAVPSLIYVVFCFWLPNSPRYCLAAGDVDGATKSLQRAARVNRVKLPEGNLLPEPVLPRARPCDLVAPGLRTTTAMLPFLWFSAAFSYYGVVLFTTEMIAIGSTCSPESFTEDLNKTVCDELDIDDYISLLWTSFAELPGLFIGCILIEAIGRRRSLSVLTLFYSLGCFLLFICMQTTPMVFLLFVCRAFIASAFQVLFVYTPEVYPTEVRALSLGTGSSFARLGAICTPYVAEVLLDISLWYGLSVYAALGVVSAILAFFLPIETKGRALRENCEGTSRESACTLSVR